VWLCVRVCFCACVKKRVRARKRELDFLRLRHASCMSHVTHAYKSNLTCEEVRSYVWMSHVAHMNGSCHTVLSHVWMSLGSIYQLLTLARGKKLFKIRKTPRSPAIGSQGPKKTRKSTDGGDSTEYKNDCQNFQQIFTWVPVHVKQIFTESTNFQTNFRVGSRRPRHSKDLSGKLRDLEIQIFKVGSPSWAAPWHTHTHVHTHIHRHTRIHIHTHNPRGLSREKRQ